MSALRIKDVEPLGERFVSSRLGRAASRFGRLVSDLIANERAAVPRGCAPQPVNAAAAVRFVQLN